MARATCAPDEGYLQVLGALIDSGIYLRAEGGAAMIAEAYGKLTEGRGICLVTRGPSKTSASPGLHIAAQDSTALILFVGQVERSPELVARAGCLRGPRVCGKCQLRGSDLPPYAFQGDLGIATTRKLR